MREGLKSVIGMFAVMAITGFLLPFMAKLFSLEMHWLNLV